MSFPRRLSPLCRFRRECSHAREVVGRLRQQEQLLDSLAPSTHDLPNPTNRLAPAKHLLDTFALALTNGVTRPACCAPVDGRAARARVVLGDMRGHAIGATRRDESRRVVVLVGPHRNRPLGKARCIGEHVSGRVSLGRTVGLRHLRVDHQAMPVVRQHVPHIAKHRACVATLAEQLRLTVAARFMRLVAALLAVPVLALVSTALGRRIVIGFVLAHEAFMASPRLNQRAVDAEVLAREMTARLRRLHSLVEQTHDDIVRQQPVSILAERRVVPHRIVHRQADKPTKQHVVGDLLHQHALAANRIQHLQQQRANQLLRRDARPAAFRVALVHAREHAVHALKCVIQPKANRPQRMIGRHEVIELRHREHRLGVAVHSAHRFALSVVPFLVSTFTPPARMTSAGGISTAC